MKFSKSKALDRLRSTVEGFTRFKFAGTAISGLGLSHVDLVSVSHQKEVLVELQELRKLVLEAISMETTQRYPASYAEIEGLSLDSINLASIYATTGDLLDPAIENDCSLEVR